MLRLIFSFILLLPSIVNSEPFKDSSKNYTDVQIYFGSIADLKCCYLLKAGEKASFDGFLLEPYQLVFLKETIDSWQEDLAHQLKQAELLCQEKTSLCQENRNLILDQYKEETDYYLQLNQQLNNKLIKVKSDYKLFKIITYVSIPVAISLGAYIAYKF